jgi:hypothetical protein
MSPVRLGMTARGVENTRSELEVAEGEIVVAGMEDYCYVLQL